MHKEIIVVVALILSVIHIVYEAINEIGDLQKDIPAGRSCTKLKNEKCTVFIWDKLFFKRDATCKREKCPGFVFHENGELVKNFSIWSILGVLIKQAPALAAVVLLLLYLTD